MALPLLHLLHLGRTPCRFLGLALLLVSLAGCPRLTRPANPDLLDQVTGTESWRVTPESLNEEWKGWYRARVAWRRDQREFKVQRVRSLRIADLVDRYPDGPDIDQVREVVLSRNTRLPSSSGQPAPDQPEPVAPGLSLDGTTKPPGKPPSRDHGRDPAPWAQVPVERLDAKGQAIDEERPKGINGGKR